MKLFLCGLLFLAFVESGISLKCYECETNDGDNCDGKETECSSAVGNPFCLKFSGKNSDGKKGAFKKCMALPMGNAKDQCETKSVSGNSGTQCTCTTDLCNNAEVSMISKVVAFSLIFVALFMQFI